MKETSIQKNILDYLQCLENRGDAYVLRTGAGAIKTEKGYYFKTGKKGCPDITLLYKGKYLGIEVKGPKGRLSLHQKKAKELIEKAGGIYWEVTSTVETIKKLSELDTSV